MKKILSFLLIAMLLLSLIGCKKEPEAAEQQSQGQTQTPEWAKKPEGEGYIDFRAEAKAPTVSEAKKILANESVDKASAEYRQAVYTVNESAVNTEVEAAKEAGKPSERAKVYFKGISFYFIEGDTFANQEIYKRVLKKGTLSQQKDGTWYLTFHDITLAQSATLTRPHALEEYTEILELLLNDTNVVVLALED